MSKSIILFNKNHIRIEKGVSNKVNGSLSAKCTVNEHRALNENKNNYKKKIKCISPLGFYYTKTEYTNIIDSMTIKEITIILPSEYAYKITYLVECNGSRISVDTRPWDIGDNESLSENHIKRLFSIIQDIMNELIFYKIPVYRNFESGYEYKESINTKWLLDMINEDIFGDKRGIRFQTDSEKIISHGFDLKTSFRKRKNED